MARRANRRTFSVSAKAYSFIAAAARNRRKSIAGLVEDALDSLPEYVAHGAAPASKHPLDKRRSRLMRRTQRDTLKWAPTRPAVWP